MLCCEQSRLRKARSYKKQAVVWRVCEAVNCCSRLSNYVHLSVECFRVCVVSNLMIRDQRHFVGKLELKTELFGVSDR